LPPREGFAPGAVGAVGLMVQRLAVHGRPSLVIGAAPAAAPFAAPPFRAAEPAGWSPNRTRRYAQGVARVLAETAPCLVEVHNRPEVALLLAARFPRVPVMLFLHNDPQGMRGAATARQRAALLHRLARVVTVSDWLRRRLLEGVENGARVEVLPNAIELAALPPALPQADRERLILFAGRVVADKGADGFVAACARALPALPGWRAEMIGADRFAAESPDTPFLRRLRPAAAAAGIAMPGYRPHPEVLTAMARAAIVAVPSRWAEPFGLTALEAMASGAALVCSDRGGLPEVAGEAALIVDPDDPNGFAQALLALARDPGRRAAMAEAGLARARRFDIGVAAAALERLRAELLGEAA